MTNARSVHGEEGGMKKMTKKPVKRSEPKKRREPTPLHQWTNGGTEVLILKCVEKDGTSYGGFKWPLTVGATLTVPSPNRKPECDGGGY